MTGTDLIKRVEARGGEPRVMEARLQYRPAGVLQPDEITWLVRNRREVVEGLLRRDGRLVALPAGPALGEAGPAVPAWHCYVAVVRPHEQATRGDGTSYCATCHPPTVARRADR